MRRITLWFMSTLTTLVLLFSYHTSTNSTGATTAIAQPVTGSGGDEPSTPTETSTSTPTTSTPTTSTPTSTSQTYTGTAFGTPYGDVVVQVTVSGGKVTKSVVTQVPWDSPRDQEINSQAVPVLNQEAVAAQSAQIDMVSGATYTSQAYAQSLQSALDQAHL